jgi:uncharacterized membrane protein YkvA (DUF1232 family)
MNQEKLNNKFNSFKNDFTQEDAGKVMENMEKIEQIMQNKTLCKFLDDVKLYFQMLGDVFTGKYKKVPSGTVAAIVGTLLYVLSPVDLLPDFLPGGFVDDAGIIGLCLTFTKYDVEQYKKFKENNDEEN